MLSSFLVKVLMIPNVGPTHGMATCVYSFDVMRLDMGIFFLFSFFEIRHGTNYWKVGKFHDL